MYGLTATPTRKDGWHKIIYMQCGDIRVRVSNKSLKQNKEMEHKVIVYDYLDNMKMLERMYDKRLSGYRMAGYEIIE